MSLLKLIGASRKLQLLPTPMTAPVVQKIPDKINFSTTTSSYDKEKVNFTFHKLLTGEKFDVSCVPRTNVLDALNENKIDAPGYGLCEGTLTCSTCTVHFSEEDFEKLDMESDIDDEEAAFLEKAYDVRKTSRLGCQVEVTKEFEGITIMIPEKTNDQRGASPLK